MEMALKWNRRTIAPSCILALLLFAVSCDEPADPFIVSLEADAARSLAARLTFNGQAAWFMFDTGAGAHTLARWFVNAAGITADDRLSEGVRARDATGQPVAIQVAQRQTGRLPNGKSLVLKSAIVADFPAEFEESEVGGLINPQLLASTDQAAVLDLRVPELRIEPFVRAVSRVGARLLTGDQFQMCVDATTSIPNLLFSVRVSVGDKNGWLQLDTGAGVTSIAASSGLAGGLELAPGGETMGVAGKPQTYSTAPNLTISFGDHHATVDAQVAERTHEGCGSDGLLGRDALGKCALVLGRESVAIACN